MESDRPAETTPATETPVADVPATDATNTPAAAPEAQAGQADNKTSAETEADKTQGERDAQDFTMNVVPKLTSALHDVCQKLFSVEGYFVFNAIVAGVVMKNGRIEKDGIMMIKGPLDREAQTEAAKECPSLAGRLVKTVPGSVYLAMTMEINGRKYENCPVLFNLVKTPQITMLVMGASLEDLLSEDDTPSATNKPADPANKSASPTRGRPNCPCPSCSARRAQKNATRDAPGQPDERPKDADGAPGENKE